MDTPDDHIESHVDDSIARDPLSDGRVGHEEHAAHGDKRTPRAQAMGYAPAAPFQNGARCVSCQYDLSGLDGNAPCPECGSKKRVGFGSVPLCTFCGYELTGMDVGGNCPECGKPIWESNIQPPTSGLSIASMVCGIVGLMSCMLYGVPTLVLGPLAVIFGEIAARQQKRGLRGGATKGFALTGRICGWIGIVFSYGFLVTIIAIMIFG